MGKESTAAFELGQQVYSGTLAASASTAWCRQDGAFNILLAGVWTGAVALEVSADGGATVVPALYADGAPVTFSTNGQLVASAALEMGMLYRLTRGAGTGTLAWRLSR